MTIQRRIGVALLLTATVLVVGVAGFHYLEHWPWFDGLYMTLITMTTIAQTAEMMKTNYGLETVIHDNPTFEDFQEILAAGHLIIAPFAGQHLGNPNYKNGGPVYHMMVVKGYDADKMQIVTDDVGTRNGADYVYSWETINFALHDWNDNDILLGEPRIIEVLQ